MVKLAKLVIVSLLIVSLLKLVTASVVFAEENDDTTGSVLLAK